MQLHLILAKARNGVIGDRGQLPWHLPEDLAHFKRTTLGCPVLMGRKTWESIPAKFRPLPGRANLVITRQADWQAEGALVVHSLEEGLSLALAHCPEGKDLWVMGGAEILDTEKCTLTSKPVSLSVFLTAEKDVLRVSMANGIRNAASNRV